MTENSRKGLGLIAAAVSLAGMAAGALFGVQGLPAIKAVLERAGNTTPATSMSTKMVRSFDGVTNHDEKITVNTTALKIMHAVDGLPMHQHAITVVTTTVETTPNGRFYDFKPARLPTVDQKTDELTAPKELVFGKMNVSPADVAPRELILVRINVTNTGTERGPFIIPLNVDGVNYKTQSITLAPGTSLDIDFSITIQSTGSHVLSIGDQQADVLVGGAVGG